MLGEWTATSVEPGAEKPDPDAWTPVTVPGRPELFAGESTVAYRSVFDDPRSGEEDRAVLELRGLYAHARIWLNDELLGEHDAYFEPFTHVFEPGDENELVVVCRAPEDRFGGIHDTDLVPETDCVPGIWWDATVDGRPGTFVADLAASPRFTDEGAAIDVRAVVDAAEAIDDRLTLSLRPAGESQSRGMMDRAQVQADANERAVVEHTIDVRDPSLWWPRGVGPQNRYSVHAKLGEDARSVTTGIRSVELTDEGLVVNGRRAPARGVNLLTATPDDVERAAAANATLARMHAHVPSPAVYEACDELGLLCWQDLPLTGPGEFDVERGRDLAARLAETYEHHPCIAAFSVHDDPVEPYPDPIGAGFLDKLRLRWRAWRLEHDREPAEAVADGFPDETPVFPVVGPIGAGADATTLFPGWDYVDAADVEWVLDTFDVGDAVAEFGAGALGSAAVDSVPGFDRAKHGARVDDGPAASQRYQASVLKRIVETLRRRNVPLAAAFALRDTREAGFGVLERDGTEKTGYPALAASLEPVQATLVDPTAGASTELVVVNDTRRDVSGSVAWTFSEERTGGPREEGAPVADGGDHVGTQAAGTGADPFADPAGETDVAVDAHGLTAVETVSVPTGAATARVRLTLADDRVENTYSL